MITKEVITGLCINCNNKENCSYLAFMKGPVVCCEEYDAYMPEEQVTVNISAKNNPGEISANAEKYSSEFKGLCINCDNNSVCKSAKLPGGIWHCEEYR